MATYHIYTGTKSTGEPAAMAISEDLLQEEDTEPQHFFRYDTTEIEKSGEIEIEGDTHLLDEYFDVRS